MTTSKERREAIINSINTNANINAFQTMYGRDKGGKRAEEQGRFLREEAFNKLIKAQAIEEQEEVIVRGSKELLAVFKEELQDAMWTFRPSFSLQNEASELIQINTSAIGDLVKEDQHDHLWATDKEIRMEDLISQIKMIKAAKAKVVALFKSWNIAEGDINIKNVIKCNDRIDTLQGQVSDLQRDIDKGLREQQEAETGLLYLEDWTVGEDTYNKDHWDGLRDQGVNYVIKLKARMGKMTIKQLTTIIDWAYKVNRSEVQNRLVDNADPKGRKVGKGITNMHFHSIKALCNKEMFRRHGWANAKKHLEQSKAYLRAKQDENVQSVLDAHERWLESQWECSWEGIAGDARDIVPCKLGATEDAMIKLIDRSCYYSRQAKRNNWSLYETLYAYEEEDLLQSHAKMMVDGLSEDLMKIQYYINRAHYFIFRKACVS